MILGAFGAVGAIAAVPIAAIAGIEERAANRRPWNLAMADLERARAAHAAAAEAYDRMQAAWEIDQPSMEMIDWKEFPFADKEDMAKWVDVEQEWRFFLESEGKLWWSPDPAATKAKHRAALDSILEFRRREAEHDARNGYFEAFERLDHAQDALKAAEQVLFDMPAPDHEALLWKLEHAARSGLRDSFPRPWEGERADPVLADARRLLSVRRA
jgi:hypothetical protein